MPFPPINLHQRISSPGRELFRRKKAPQAQPELLKSKPVEEEIKHFSEKLSASWTSANLRNLGRKPQLHKTKPLPSPTNTTTTNTQGLVAAGQEARRGGGNPRLTVPKPQDSSCDALTLSSSMEDSSATASHRSSRQSSSRGSLGKEPPDIQFTLSLTPEAILVIQKRNLEKQQRTSNNKQQKACCAPGAAGDFRHRRVFPSSSSKKTHGGGGTHQQHRSGIPVVCNKQPSGAAEQQQQPDITAIVKISLLNDQYKYDDVEYEEEDGDVDETVVRKCKEWLKGVESAAAFGKADKLCALPHLKGY